MLNICKIETCFKIFSSRRRHTRFDCDWSSDVCSSDLPGLGLESYGLRLSCLIADLCTTRRGANRLDTCFRAIKKHMSRRQGDEQGEDKAAATLNKVPDRRGGAIEQPRARKSTRLNP